MRQYKLVQGDCLKVMKKIPDQSIDLILCDLPYGTTACKWDTVIDFKKLWSNYMRIIKPSRAIVLFGTEPFSSQLRLSNLEYFKYDWYWRKSRPGNFVSARLRPLKDIETISVFSDGKIANGAKSNMIYNPQGLIDVDIEWRRPTIYMGSSGVSPTRKNHKLVKKIEKSGYPRQVLDYSNPNKNLLHPTQKPTDLLEYLIKTYSNKGDLILDNTMGSGSTGVAALNTKRRFIGIEKEKQYFEIAVNRLKTNPKKLF